MSNTALVSSFTGIFAKDVKTMENGRKSMGIGDRFKWLLKNLKNSGSLKPSTSQYICDI